MALGLLILAGGLPITLAQLPEAIEASLERIDGLLLATTVYHALNGTRTVIFDFNVGSAAKRWITFLLWAFGIVATVYGINALLPFMGYSPFFGG